MISSLYTITVLELFMGGGGRLLEFGPITLRMVLFVLCVISTFWIIGKGIKHDRGAIVLAALLSGAYILIQLLGLINGVINGFENSDMIADIKPSLYWLGAPFFAAVLGSRDAILHTSSLARACGFGLAALYLITILGLVSGNIDFIYLYERLDATGEFFFRGGVFFFYKGFLYLAISIIFFVATRGRAQKTAAILVGVALVLTLTRGFVIATAITFLFLLFSLRRWGFLAVGLVFVMIAFFAVWVYLPELSGDYLNQRDVSNNIRLGDISFILSNATPKTYLIGDGFGSYINDRLNIENTYLWVLWKTGILGLIFWLMPFVLSTFYYQQIRFGRHDYELASALYYSLVLVYIQTATNPFLNNPIGLSFVLIALFSLRTLAKTAALSDNKIK